MTYFDLAPFARRCVIACLLAFLPSCLEAQNLLVNGDFSAGKTGFISNYAYSSDLQPEGTYYIGGNPNYYHPGGASFGDHTTGTGQMFIANASSSTANLTLWQETVAVAAHQDYVFSGWAASWGQTNGGFDQYPAVLRVMINGVQVGADFTLISADGHWAQFTANWNSGSATSAVINIVDINTASSGNDFAIDDLQFNAVSLPGTINGKVILQGIVAYASPQSISFDFRPVSGGSVINRVVSVPPAGSFSISGLPRNQYTARVKGDKWLAKTVSVDTTNGDVSGVNILLSAGDANNDNSVDSTDFGVLIGAYGSDASISGSGYDANADFNCDGLIDSTDFGILIGSFNQTGAL